MMYFQLLLSMLMFWFHYVHSSGILSINNIEYSLECGLLKYIFVFSKHYYYLNL